MADSNAQLKKVEERLIAEGKLLEAGWIGLRIAAIPPDAPKLQLQEMRNAFFAGANHLFHSIMNVLDEGAEPTDADMDRMTKIQGELDAFIREFELRNFPTKGNG